MKKRLVMLVAVLAMVAIAVPAFALEFKYGGMYRLRWQSNDNITDGHDPSRVGPATFDYDNQNYMDQRLRMYFSFVGSENLQVVTKWEVDTLWGMAADKFSTGGGVGADSINLEMKNVYVDFNVPYTPIRATLGVQGIQLMSGWIIDDDFSAAKFSAKFAPFSVTVGYVAGSVTDAITWDNRIDDWFISLDYAEGPWKAALIGYFQDAHGTDASTFFNPRMSTGLINTGNYNFTYVAPPALPGAPAATYTVSSSSLANTATVGTYGTQRLVGDNYLFDLGLSASYKIDWINAYLNFVKNFGSFDLLPDMLSGHSIDYTGYMVEAGVNVFYGPLTFNLGGFLASGDNFDYNLDSSDSNYRYVRGASHYWSEILGLGSLDQSVGGSYLNTVRTRLTTTSTTVRNAANTGTTTALSSATLGSAAVSARTEMSISDVYKNLPGNYGYQAGDVPSNLWMINLGVAYQALEKTKLTVNYYYVGTQAKVLSGYDAYVNPINHLVYYYDTYSNSIGHELDFYVDQGIVDNLNLRLVFAYMFSNAGYTIYNNDDDSWETGFVLSWHF